MAPKKKGNKRQEEDWEADLGESAPATAPADEQPQEDANEEAAPVGGLMAALRKNKAKKAKKGKTNDFVEGEDAEGADTQGPVDLASKQPEEGNFDDDDVFAGKKTKPIKEVVKPAAEEQPEGEFRVKSKKEKEREKKEKEKQRKKEQVGFYIILDTESPFRVSNPFTNVSLSRLYRLPQRRSSPLLKKRPKPRRPPPPRPPRTMQPPPLHPPQRLARRRSFLPT